MKRHSIFFSMVSERVRHFENKRSVKYRESHSVVCWSCRQNHQCGTFTLFYCTLFFFIRWIKFFVCSVFARRFRRRWAKVSCHRDVATKTGQRRRDGQETAKRERKKQNSCAPCATAFFTFWTFCAFRTFRSRSCLIQEVKWPVYKTETVGHEVPGFVAVVCECMGGYCIAGPHQLRAVFKWLSKNQNQSNYSDQSRQGQTARWTNHNS